MNIIKINSVVLRVGLALTSSATASTIIENWSVHTDSPANSVNSGLNTDSPTFGDGTAENVEDTFFLGQFSETTLGIGESISVSFDINFTGGVLGHDKGFRVIMGDANPTIPLAWLFVNGEDLYQARADGGLPTTMGGNAVNLSATKSPDLGTFSADSVADYSFSFSVMRDTVDTASLVASLQGGDLNLDRVYAANATGVAEGYFTFNALGLRFNDGLDLDQARINSSSIPEPSSVCLLVIGAGFIVRHRKRK